MYSGSGSMKAEVDECFGLHPEEDTVHDVNHWLSTQVE